MPYRSTTRIARHALAAPPVRLVGFLGVNRRVLAVCSLGFAVSLASLQALPAEASNLEADARASVLQGFASPIYLPVPTLRDDFAISVFSLVQWPVPASTTMTSGYGYRSCSGCSEDHKGIDLTPGSGYPIQSVADGVVVLAEEDSGGLGVHVVVEHVIDGERVQTVYGHMLNGSMTVSAGQTVSRGEQIGQVGNTGSSTGAHLHFEVIIDDVQINPLPWLMTHANS